MSGLKSIELQVALPRTQTAGKLQDQLQQRSTVMQEHLSQHQHAENIRKRSQVSETEKTEKKRLNNDDERNKGNKKHQEQKNRKKRINGDSFERNESHPYKGNSIDVKW
ncbi:hypothetical protein QA612_11755 [Evansella sp. AB-P1]|uniref:hypothetical protein n=1 Tax=Evansella sp. AB-P1 TaxID=3037653 RepID=UPI00241ECBC4|nr:hypothetical protein [Evansella sp. AB-P1]MDG5788163.1 hypothetical protein [Evansella sp. AB-P1]